MHKFFNKVNDRERRAQASQLFVQDQKVGPKRKKKGGCNIFQYFRIGLDLKI